MSMFKKSNSLSEQEREVILKYATKKVAEQQLITRAKVADIEADLIRKTLGLNEMSTRSIEHESSSEPVPRKQKFFATVFNTSLFNSNEDKKQKSLSSVFKDAFEESKKVG